MDPFTGNFSCQKDKWSKPNGFRPPVFPPLNLSEDRTLQGLTREFLPRFRSPDRSSCLALPRGCWLRALEKKKTCEAAFEDGPSDCRLMQYIWLMCCLSILLKYSFMKFHRPAPQVIQPNNKAIIEVIKVFQKSPLGLQIILKSR